MYMYEVLSIIMINQSFCILKCIHRYSETNLYTKLDTNVIINFSMFI